MTPRSARACARSSAAGSHARGMPVLARTLRVIAAFAALLAGAAVGFLPAASAAAHAASSQVTTSARGSITQSPSSAPSGATLRTMPDAVDGSLPDAAITGRVLGATGLPLAGACITVTGQHTVAFSRADGTGTFRVSGLRAGSYEAGVADCTSKKRGLSRWYGGGFSAAGVAHVLVLPGRTSDLGAVRLLPARPEATVRAAAASDSTISGTVRSAASGKPLSGVCVIASSSTDILAEITNNNGRYYVGPSVGYKVEVSFSVGCGNNDNYAPQWWKYSATQAKATFLTGTARHHVTGIDARLVRGGEISGTVRLGSAKGAALRGICVEVSGADELATMGPTVTSSGGKYLVKGLATGVYQLTFTPGCGNNSNYLPLTYPRSIRVTVGKTTQGVNAVMQPAGIISGTVTSAATSAPLQGICVNVYAANGFVTDDDLAIITDDDGGYQIAGVPPGSYRVYFFGCSNSASYAPQFYDGQADLEAGKLVRVALGQTRSGIDARMEPGATISGTVTDSAGADLLYVCMYPITPQSLTGPSAGPGTQVSIDGDNATASSNANGTYTITNLAPGPYYVGFSSCLGSNLAQQWYPASADITSASLVSTRAGTVTSGIDVAMPTGGVITGTVRNGAGKLVPNFCVDASSVSDPALIQATGPPATYPPTNMNGQYQINQLATGDYNVEFVPCAGGGYANQWFRGKPTEASATVVKVTAGKVTSDVNAVLRPGQPVSGTVRSGVTNKPIAGLCVRATDSAGNEVAEVQTNSAGQYTLDEIAAGTYTLEFFDCNQLSPALAPVARDFVVVSATKPTTGINAVLRPGGSIAGTVSGAAPGGGATAGEPGICVVATRVGGYGADTVALTGATGAYHFTAVAPGRYSLLFTPDCLTADEALAPQPYPRVVTVTAKTDLTGVDVTLASDGQITGTVTGTASEGIAGICVTAQSAVPGTSPVVAVTGTTGAYTVGSLVPGSYTVRFSADCGATGYQTQWWDDATSVTGATPVTVSPGTTASDINAQLTPGS